MTTALNPLIGGQFPQATDAEKRSIKRIKTSKTFEAAVAATTAEIPLAIPPGTWRVVAISVLSPAARSADVDGTDKYTLQLARRDSADYTTADVIFTSDFQAANFGALAAFTPKLGQAAGYNYANAQCDGQVDCLTILLTKGGSGANFAAGTRVSVEMERV